ncbi:hypothetical protein BJY24_003924 [Nocardia transvalensis]|uniref:Uncharacterized protein n=1 Tax=Nocardia transvalensis TaxID=37333 RepID=A0A7W9PFC6_9NOCA|nr:hypothetical protein [Nocardia transvalensis]MBB5915057.1 hypothetical protein [Nocardia transvalensis]
MAGIQQSDVERRVDMPFTYCRIDPGPVPKRFGRLLVRIHADCDEMLCRPKLRGVQSVSPGPGPDAPLICRVADDRIVAIVSRYADAEAALKAAQAAFCDGYPEATKVMLTAANEFASARHQRDSQFLHSLPGDGTIPVATITKFGLSYTEVHRLLGGLGPANGRWVGM